MQQELVILKKKSVFGVLYRRCSQWYMEKNMEFEKISDWGLVDPGTKVVDSKGNQYIVGPQNDRGFLCLRNISGGENIAFEVFDGIDHNEFRLAARK